jgi:hypothetical protein
VICYLFCIHIETIFLNLPAAKILKLKLKII